MTSWVVHGRIYVSSFQTIALLSIDKAIIQFVSIFFSSFVIFVIPARSISHTLSFSPMFSHALTRIFDSSYRMVSIPWVHLW